MRNMVEKESMRQSFSSSFTQNFTGITGHCLGALFRGYYYVPTLKILSLWQMSSLCPSASKCRPLCVTLPEHRPVWAASPGFLVFWLPARFC